jgi:hypothetical protein
MFTVNQIQNILDIIARNNIIFIGAKIGPDYLTEDEKNLLLKYNINPYHLYRPENDFLNTQFHLGLISDAIGILETQKLTYKDLQDYFIQGKYIPLTEVEKGVLNSIKLQSLSDIKGLQGRIFKDINNIIDAKQKGNRVAYEEVIRNEVLKGLEAKKTAVKIASELGHKTGDWTRDFRRIVEYVSHQAFDEGRVAMIERKSAGKEIWVYKSVYLGACKHCVRLYLTGDIGSRPKVFKLSELKANGTNIGRKVEDWKPVIGSTHPYCRCTIDDFDPRFEWNPKSGLFDILLPNVKEKLRDRKPIRISVGKKEYVV